MDTSSSEPAWTDDALRYVLANVDDAHAALDTANKALAIATAYGRIVVARNTRTKAGAAKRTEFPPRQRPQAMRCLGPLVRGGRGAAGPPAHLQLAA